MDDAVRNGVAGVRVMVLFPHSIPEAYTGMRERHEGME